MTRILTIIALLFATPAWAEKINLFGEEFEVRATLSCIVLSDIEVRMDDFNISSRQYEEDTLKLFDPTIVKMLANGDLVIGLDRFKRYRGKKESNEGFFIWTSLQQVELTQTGLGLLMIWNERDGMEDNGKYRIWSEHRWYRCSQ
jgi:hypothetical protein